MEHIACEHVTLPTNTQNIAEDETPLDYSTPALNNMLWSYATVLPCLEVPRASQGEQRVVKPV